MGINSGLKGLNWLVNELISELLLTHPRTQASSENDNDKGFF